MCHISLARFTGGRASKDLALQAWPAPIRKKKGNNFLIYLAKMAKNVHYFLDDEDTDQCASTSEKSPNQRSLWSLRNYFISLSFYEKDISHGKYFVLIGSIYSGTTPKMYITSLHIYLCTKFSIT